MKAFYYDENGSVVDIHYVVDAASARRVILGEYPPYVQKDGFGGRLVVRDGALVWEYVETPVNNDVTQEELNSMVEKVM